jgi:hypothetical protein
MSLYQVSQEFKQFEEQLELLSEMAATCDVDSSEDIEQMIADTLESISSEFDLKADNLACIIKNFNVLIAGLDAEEKELAKRRRAKERTVEKLKLYLSHHSHALGKIKLETPRNRISHRESKQVSVPDEGAFIAWAVSAGRDDLLTFKDPTINKTAVKKAITGGEDICGAHIISKMNIQIK